jgi:hypothetical protein
VKSKQQQTAGELEEEGVAKWRQAATRAISANVGVKKSANEIGVKAERNSSELAAEAA